VAGLDAGSPHSADGSGGVRGDRRASAADHQSRLDAAVHAYGGLLVFHHLASLSYCPICIQAYANYFNYLGGLAIHGLLRRFSFALAGRAIAVVAIVAAVVTAAVQSWSLTGVNRPPSLRNSVDALPQEVRETSAMLAQSLQEGSPIGVVGLDPRILLALARADIRVPAVSLSLGFSYRQLKPNLTDEQEAQTIKQLEELSGWTDTTAKRWIETDYD
jgi:hypothetical protein